ncbi:hypothetical protein EWB00_004233 [Schistosoma japonicum]|uniref:Ig-like domain-containing protein n=1 Tax=Schistosoma japonicum TaxID=6182 RepID=A0A4Z2D691_SCHJA|nr:hypothetical protein EWB00_004233 [Schistosoma japonicum]
MKNKMLVKQYLLHYTLINYVIILKLLHNIDSELQVCSFDVPKIQTIKNCERDRIEKAGKRHQFLLFSAEDMNITFNLLCPICEHEMLNSFEWNYIPDYKKQQLILIKSNKTLYESYIMLKNELLEKVVDDLCVSRSQLQLIGLNINANRYLGTYVCMYLEDRMHPANFIWYHLYRIGSFKKNSKPINISNITGFFHKIQSIEQIPLIQNQVNTALDNISELADRHFSSMTITFKVNHDNDSIKHCGKIAIRQYRRCYLKIPRFQPILKATVNNPHSYEDNIFEINKLLRLSFEFLTRLHDLELDSANQLARSKAKRLGFELYIDKAYIHIPCEYELLQHLFIPIDNFPPASRYAEIKYEMLCNQTDPIKFSLLKDQQQLFHLKQLQMNHTIQHNNHLEIYNLYMIEYQKHVILKCNSNEIKTSLKCITMHSDVYWRSSTNMKYAIRTNVTKNIYVTDDCDLKFETIHRHDIGIYYCHVKNITFSHSHSNNTYQTITWIDRPIVAYSLYIQKMRNNHQWPFSNNVYNEWIILIIWSLILTIIWILFLYCVNDAKKIHLNTLF